MVYGLEKISNLQMLGFFTHAQEYNEINIVYYHPKFTHTKVN